MPRQRRRGRSSSGEGDYSLGTGIKNVAKKGIEGYLKGTQKMADKLVETFPALGTTRGGGTSGRRGGRGRTGRGGRRGSSD